MKKNIYVCGPTVYDTPHIGNMRPILTFDIFNRALMAQGIEVNFVHNITDIDDKIIAKAKQENKTEQQISNRYANEYFDLLNKFNINKPTSMPMVMDSLSEIISFIKDLEEKGFAYESNGSVFFDTSKLADYGKVANRKLDEMQYEKAEGKKHPADFALWKMTRDGIKFPSPWGEGRPGWHTECALFIKNEFNGETIDIHGGGIDLIFPHHENEQAQFKALTNKDITNEWKHIGHLFVDGQKMSKSIGNIWSANDFIEKVGADELRYIFLTSNITSPLDLTEEIIENAKSQIKKWKKIYNFSQIFTSISDDKNTIQKVAPLITGWKFAEANKEINEILKSFNKDKTELNAISVRTIFNMLGFHFTSQSLPQNILDTYTTWQKLKEEQNYTEADKLRDILAKEGLV